MNKNEEDNSVAVMIPTTGIGDDILPLLFFLNPTLLLLLLMLQLLVVLLIRCGFDSFDVTEINEDKWAFFGDEFENDGNVDGSSHNFPLY